MIEANLTFFDRSVMPTNLLTVPEWRTLAQASGVASWKAAARAWAKRKGGALVLRADGSLQVFTRRDGKISQATYKPGKWAWERPERCTLAHAAAHLLFSEPTPNWAALGVVCDAFHSV